MNSDEVPILLTPALLKAYPDLDLEHVKKAFPDIELGPVVKAFPDIELGQVLKIHRDELGDPSAVGKNLSLVILRTEPSGGGVRIGHVSDDPGLAQDALSDFSEALGALDVTVVDGEGWATIVTVTDVHPAADD